MCGYCFRAISLLTKKGVAYTEISAAFDEKLRKEMVEKSGGRTTYPQIFVGSMHVGGFDELDALERAGKLDAMLAAA